MTATDDSHLRTRPLLVYVGIAFDVPWADIRSVGSMIRIDDAIGGARRLAIDAVVVGAIAWFGLAPLSRTDWSLPAKLAAFWLASLVANHAIGLVLPG